MTTVKRYPNFLTQSQCTKILEWLEPQPYAKTRYKTDSEGNEIVQYGIKHLDLHLGTGVVCEIINPLIMNTFGRLPTNSSFTESHEPFALHVDTPATFEQKGYESLHKEDMNLSFIIPLKHGPGHQTVFFDYYRNTIDNEIESAGLKTEKLAVPQFDGVEDLSHLTNTERHILAENNIRVDDYENWKIGDAFSWLRTQLHCAGNINTRGAKEAIVLFF